MTDFPFEAILIYLTILFAPLDADRFVLDITSESQHAEVIRNGQTWQFEGYVFETNEDSLLVFGAEGRETYKISEFVSLPNDESRVTNRTFALGAAGTVPLVTSIDLTVENAFDPQLRSGDTIHLPGRGESASGGQ